MEFEVIVTITANNYYDYNAAANSNADGASSEPAPADSTSMTGVAAVGSPVEAIVIVIGVVDTVGTAAVAVTDRTSIVIGFVDCFNSMANTRTIMFRYFVSTNSDGIYYGSSYTISYPFVSLY